MDILYISLCFMGLIGLIASGTLEDPLEVDFKNSTLVHVSEGAQNIHFKCHLNRGPMFVLNNKVEMVHMHPVSGKETVLSSKGDLEEGEPEFYSVKIENDPSADSVGMVLDFTILKVRFKDDGKFLCKVHGEDEIQAEREIVVHRPIKSLFLKFGDNEPLADSPSEPIDIDAGKYKVSCIAEGSNPATDDMHMYLHGEMVKHGEVSPVLMEGTDRMYRTTLEGEVDIMVQNSGQEIECQAIDSSGNSLSTKLSISVNTYDPVVSCNDSVAYHGQDNPILTCTVNFTGIEVEGYAFQLGESGEIIREGDDHAKNIEVSVESVSDNVVDVSLDLHKAEKEYLDKHYYLLINVKGGHTTKQSVRLNKIDAPVSGNSKDEPKGDPNGAAQTSASVLLYTVLCVLLRSL